MTFCRASSGSFYPPLRNLIRFDVHALEFDRSWRVQVAVNEFAEHFWFCRRVGGWKWRRLGQELECTQQRFGLVELPRSSTCLFAKGKPEWAEMSLVAVGSGLLRPTKDKSSTQFSLLNLKVSHLISSFNPNGRLLLGNRRLSLWVADLLDVFLLAVSIVSFLGGIGPGRHIHGLLDILSVFVDYNRCARVLRYAVHDLTGSLQAREKSRCGEIYRHHRVTCSI